MTTPTQDMDHRATLSAPREPTAEALEAAAARLLRGRKNGRHYYGPAGRWQVYQCNDDLWSAGALMPLPQGAPVDDSRSLWYHGRPTAQAAAVDLLRHHPELWPAEPDEAAPEPQPLTVAAREALRLVVRAGHEASPSEWDDSESCCICSEPWPCEVEQARRILADALDTDADADADALVAVDALSPQEDR